MSCDGPCKPPPAGTPDFPFWQPTAQFRESTWFLIIKSMEYFKTF